MNAIALRGPAQHAPNASIAAEERALANYSHKSPYRPDAYLLELARDVDAGYLDDDAADQLERDYERDCQRDDRQHRIGGWLARMAEGLLPASDLTNHCEPVL